MIYAYDYTKIKNSHIWLFKINGLKKVPSQKNSLINFGSDLDQILGCGGYDFFYRNWIRIWSDMVIQIGSNFGIQFGSYFGIQLISNFELKLDVGPKNKSNLYPILDLNCMLVPKVDPIFIHFWDLNWIKVPKVDQICIQF